MVELKAEMLFYCKNNRIFADAKNIIRYEDRHTDCA